MQKEKRSMKSLMREKKNSFVGYCKVELVDNHCGVMFPMSVMYPTYEDGKIEELGQFSLDLSINAKPKEGKFPLILISHGSGGSHLLYRTLAHYLACNGFIVGMPEHPFNNRNNNTLEGTVENLENRPRHIHTAIDWFFESEKFARFLKADSISMIGHSMGGYTSLAVAGGIPTSFPNESLDGKPKQINVEHNRKIKSLVLLAPATVWFKDKGALSGVDIPILMIAGEKDQYTPHFHAQIVLEGVADNSKIKYKIIENAGHFSFLSPFPQSMIKPEFIPSQDPFGFHREKFHNELNIEILDFLMQVK